MRPATTSGHSNVLGTSSRDGEQVGGVGSRYAVTLNERTNKSFGQTDLAGPTGRSTGTGRVPVVGIGSRKTGQV